MNDFERHLSRHVDAVTPHEVPPFAAVVARRDRATRTRRTLVAAGGASTLVAAIVVGSVVLRPSGSSTAPPATTPSASSTPAPTDDPELPKGRPVPADWDGKGVPPVTLHLDGTLVPLQPWTSCFTGPPGQDGTSGVVCSDGFPQPPFEDVGDRAAVPFSFPVPGWTFQATFSPPGEGRCERTFTVPVEKTGERTFSVPPAGPPGAYDVDVFGRGPEGDVITTFAWTTAQPGALPEPSGYLGLVSDDGDRYVANPVELGLDGLATTPSNATVTVTVTAADGATKTYAPITADKRCSNDVSFRQGGAAGAAQPFELGPAPFDYRAEVTLDGVTYVGTAVWPRDERRDEAPYTDLTFDPPLPGYEG